VVAFSFFVSTVSDRVPLGPPKYCHLFALRKNSMTKLMMSCRDLSLQETAFLVCVDGVQHIVIYIGLIFFLDIFFQLFFFFFFDAMTCITQDFVFMYMYIYIQCQLQNQ
jgi:hypothetical protein